MPHDLSFNEVVLDYGELLKTAQIAVGSVNQKLHKQLDAWYTIGKTVTKTEADLMETTAKQLAQVTKTLHALVEGETRENIVIINHKLVEQSTSIRSK